MLATFRSVKPKAYFILQLGYFKVKHQFFMFDLHEVEEDLRYILNVHFNNREMVDLNVVGKNTRLKQQQLIRELFNFRNCDAKEKQQLEKKAYKAATFSGKSIFIIREIVNYLSEQRIVIPGYSFMQETVGKAITHEQNRLIVMMQNHL